MPSSENKGIGANRTSYNEKQEVEAKVNGVLKNSTDIRNTLLNKNNGKYVMYDETLVPAIGEEYDVYERENNRPKQIGLGGLFNYTNTNSSEFGKKTLEKYYRDEDNIEAYNVLNPNPIALSNWGGKYDNYLQYVYNTYGKELAFINFLDSILSENELKFALNKDKVGVLRDSNDQY